MNILLVFSMFITLASGRPFGGQEVMVNCHNYFTTTCLAYITQVTQNTNLSFPITRKELTETCSADQCTERYIAKCTARQVNQMLREMIRGTKNFLQNLCQIGKIQNDYLRYARCFKEIALTTCYPSLQRFQSLFADPGTEMLENFASIDPAAHTGDSEFNLWQFCCSYKETIDCEINSIETVCEHSASKEAVSFFHYYTKQMSNRLLTEHCLSYTYSDRCLANQSDPAIQLALPSSAPRAHITVILFITHIAFLFI